MTTTCARIPGSGDAPDLERMGGKGAALARLARAGLPVPVFVVLPPAACHDALAARDRSWPALPEGASALDDAWRDALRDALTDRCGGAAAARATQWAVRSSGLDEDGAGYAFAGQFDSILEVAWDDLDEAIARVWRSGAGERVRAYRREHGLDESGHPPAVIVQRMVDADAAGVAFGADPVSGRRGVRVVSAVPGLGEALVSGERDADTWWIDRRGVVVDRQRAANDDTGSPAIDDGQAIAVARLAERCGLLFGRPQDIEWAIAAGTVHLLQSRAITSLAGHPDPDAPAVLWDNSNIAESYSGVTSAMTFSFARRVYEAVYREFCRLMKVAPHAIEANDQVFAHMLGRVRGRVYYHLHHWYRVLALLPGFQANRAFMEQMMGVREGLPDDIAAELAEATWSERAADRVRLVHSAVALAWHHFTLPRAIARFQKRLDTALAEPDPPLHACRLDELSASYRSLESALLRRWDAPLVNDFLAMIFFGVLGELAARWCDDENDSLQNDLLVGEGGIISAEPAHLVMEMARRIKNDADLTARFVDEDAAALRRSLGSSDAHRDLAAAVERYLDRFGDRCLEELKLESATLADDPTPLFRSIGGAAQALADRDPGAEAGSDAAAAVRRTAEDRVTAALTGHPLRRTIFRWVLRHARGRVRDRENLRFERTRLFGRVRRLVLEMGRRLAADGALDDKRDVFHLELHELLGAIEGDAACDDLRGLATVRAADDARHRAAPPPPERLITHGPPVLLATLVPDLTGAGPVPVATDDDVLRGLGCCPGIVRGRARVIREPRGVRLEPGDILVAERTDPGWILLFPAAAGVLVERGSLLSHSAIVARELGLPAVVSIPRLMTTLEDGETIEMDGSAGTVRRLDTDPDTDADENPGAGSPVVTTEAQGRARFDEVRYAQCWEDADVLLDGLDVQPGDTCLSIASAGDNALALLTRDPARVYAIDLNPAQLACVELRRAAYRTLQHDELLELLGSTDAEPGRRPALYKRCRDALDEESRRFWDDRPTFISAGAGTLGKFERYFRTFRTRVLPLVHGRRRVARLLRGGTAAERRSFYDDHWDTRRWRLLFRVFFSRFVMGRLGRDPAFFKYVEGSVADRILERTEHALTALDPAGNPYLQFLLTGRHRTALPVALRPEHFETIRDRLDRLVCRQTTIESFLADAETPAIDRFNLSDIFEYMSDASTAAIFDAIAGRSPAGARLVYWNMLVPREGSAVRPDHFERLDEASRTLHDADKAFFYSRVIVEQRR